MVIGVDFLVKYLFSVFCSSWMVLDCCCDIVEWVMFSFLVIFLIGCLLK